MKIIFSLLVIYILNWFMVSDLLAARKCTTPSCNLAGQDLRIVLPPINDHAIDPFDEKQEWTRSTPEESLQGATIKIIEREFRAHLEKYFNKGLIFDRFKKKSDQPAIWLILYSDQQDSDVPLIKEHQQQLMKLKPQGYGLLFYRGKIIIIARNAVGLLYGTYGLFEKLGFRWFAPEKLWEVRPEKLSFNSDRLEEFVNPKMNLRGFWTWDAGSDQFMMWMARNRFNLIGDGKYNIDLAKALGIKIWGGGHNVISYLLNPLRDTGNGLVLGQLHPTWYGLPANVSLDQVKKLKWKEDTYTNPCILDDQLLDYFSQQLVKEVKQGKYSNVDILNLWLSDSKPIIIPKTCKYKEKYINQTSALFQFYQSVIERISRRFVAENIKRPFYIGGISYYTTWQLPKNIQPPKTYTENRVVVRYIHFLYLNQRSYTADLFGSNNAGSINLKIADRFEQWAGMLSRRGTDFGTVEYYNYSVYLTLPKFFSCAWEDFDHYYSLGSKFNAYMHVLGGNMGPKRLLHRMMSLHSWSKEQTNMKILEDYFIKLYGKKKWVVAESYKIMDSALSNISEVLGPISSLNLYLNQKSYWRKPPLTKEVVEQSIKRILQGGCIELPIIYKRWPSLPTIKTCIIGLSQSIKDLIRAEQAIEQAMKASSGQLSDRLKSDLYWFSYARQIYQALELVALRKLAEDAENEVNIDTERQNELLNELSTFPYMNSTLSKLNQKKILYRMIGFSN